MSRRFAQIAFTPLVKEEQVRHGSRHLYARFEDSSDGAQRSSTDHSSLSDPNSDRLESDLAGSDPLGAEEQAFIGERDGFYMASVTETGWPYIQFRGGQPGFLHVMDDQTVGFADLRGNRQYVSTANLKHDNRVALFLMDYAAQTRLKILGRAEVREGDAEARTLLETLRVPEEKTPAERAIVIHVEGFDWNCPQHITPRYTEAEMSSMLKPIRLRLEALEAENKRLREAAAKRDASSA